MAVAKSIGDDGSHREGLAVWEQSTLFIMST